jgi:alkylation response protein AidB-like acyl-CoA dehydrogenase
VLLDPSEEQEFFQANTAKFLADQMPITEVRRLRHDPTGFEMGYWRRGANLGWTSLLVAEEFGGGSISGQGLVDLTLIAYEFGRGAAAGPLLDTNVVAAALSDAGGQQHGDVLTKLVAGDAIASCCSSEPFRGGLDIEACGDEVTINGAARPVESADVATYLLATGRGGGGLSQALVPAHAAGVTVEPLQSVDQTRRFFEVTFGDVRVPAAALVGPAGAAAEQVEHQLQLASVILSAEMVGAMQAAFDMTVEWAFDRYTFGRPLVSYQALKHRFANMKSWLEAAHALADSAAVAVHEGTPDAAELASSAKAFISHYGPELMQECVQLHGGIGLTYEHNLHLFLRRVTLDATLRGTASEHRMRLAAMAERSEDQE